MKDDVETRRKYIARAGFLLGGSIGVLSATWADEKDTEPDYSQDCSYSVTCAPGYEEEELPENTDLADEDINMTGLNQSYSEENTR